MPLPIGFGKTISQPFVVALMTDLLNLASGDEGPRGRQWAWLSDGDFGAPCRRSVWSVEIVEEFVQCGGGSPEADRDRER